MKSEAVANIITGLKEAAIDFIVTLPSSTIAPIIPKINDEQQFKHVPVNHEGDGIGICAGAWLGGKKPAILLENTGVILGAYALTGLDCMYGGFPLLMIVDHRGSFGDGAAYFYFGGGLIAPAVLEALKIPYMIVRESNKLIDEIVQGQKTTQAYGKPVAILLSGEEVSGEYLRLPKNSGT
jgi:sulfopyruvate decarboxylase subunit alpha